jgi:hypothetical protein
VHMRSAKLTPLIPLLVSACCYQRRGWAFKLTAVAALVLLLRLRSFSAAASVATSASRCPYSVSRSFAWQWMTFHCPALHMLRVFERSSEFPAIVAASRHRRTSPNRASSSPTNFFFARRASFCNCAAETLQPLSPCRS